MGRAVMGWKRILGGIAPTLATALGGPMAGAATKFIASEFLGDENVPESEVAKFVENANPDQLAKIKEIDNNFEVKMKELGVDIAKLNVDDRKSARELAKANMWPQIILSFVFIKGYFALIALMFTGYIELNETIRDMAMILIGVLSGGVPMILRFWFGGSLQDEQNQHRLYNANPNDLFK